MKALTIYEPWATMIAQGHKPIENRSWVPPKGLLKPGERIAIHASLRKPEPEDIEFCAQVTGLSVGVIAAHLRPGHILATAQYRGVQRESTSPWYVGPVAWILGDVREVVPVQIRGQQGLWELPSDVAAGVS